MIAEGFVSAHALFFVRDGVFVVFGVLWIYRGEP